MRKHYSIIIFLFIFLFPFARFAQDQANILAFPGAEGYGRFASGGRGGEVVYVTNLNDNGPGSLREAVELDKPRIILFSVSGYIELESSLIIENGDLTIAGHTAPGDGICLKNYPVEINADNVIVRYIRSRLGVDEKQQEDAISVRFSNNMIIDHCSFSWAVDEAATFYTNENFTLQWCIISESLNSSVHEKGEHGYGGIWGGRNVTFHHNLLAHHKSRNPRFSGLSGDGDFVNRNVDFRNNVIYNWADNSSYGGEEGTHNIINNYYKPGSATEKNVKDRIVNPFEPYGKFYLEGNVVEGNEEVTSNNFKGIECDDPAEAVSNVMFDSAPVSTQSPHEAFDLVLKHAGASHCRDSVDERIVKEVENGNATYSGVRSKLPGIIDTPKDVGGYPELKSRPAPLDTDKDGMPDKWEIENGLNPNSYEDHNGHALHPVYDNIEVYLNDLAGKK